jgi:hypothetical protein
METNSGNVGGIIKVHEHLEFVRDLFSFESSRGISLNKLDSMHEYGNWEI